MAFLYEEKEARELPTVEQPPGRTKEKLYFSLPNRFKLNKWTQETGLIKNELKYHVGYLKIETTSTVSVSTFYVY